MTSEEFIWHPVSSHTKIQVHITGEVFRVAGVDWGRDRILVYSNKDIVPGSKTIIEIRYGDCEYIGTIKNLKEK